MAFCFVETFTRGAVSLVSALPGVFGYLRAREDAVRAHLVELVEVGARRDSGLVFFFPRGDVERERRRRGERERERER